MKSDKFQKKNITENDTQAEQSFETVKSTVTKRVLSFDIYFQLLMNRGSKVKPHHKAAMKKYAEQNQLDEATEEDFDKVFKKY